MNFCFKYNEYGTIKSTKTIQGKILNKYKSQKKYIADDIKSINFINKYSIQDDILMFTNKFQRKSGSRISSIRGVIEELLYNPNLIKYYFDGREIECITPHDKKKLERLDKILKLNANVPNGAKVLKYVPNKNYYDEFNFGNYERGFQMILSYNNGNIVVYLIDLYHLAIESKNNDFRIEYNILKNYKKCLSETIFVNELIQNKEYKELETIA